MEEKIRALMQSMGIIVSDEVFEEVKDAHARLNHLRSESEFFPVWNEQTNEKKFAGALTVFAGAGKFSEDFSQWSPTSNIVYSFDGEFFDVDNMYSLFMQGISAIVDDAQFDAVQEDLSGMTDEETFDKETPIPTNGVRCVSFLCNSHPYSIKLRSLLDWLNPEIIDFLNQTLEKEGCRGRLYSVGEPYDQQITLFYGSLEEAQRLAEAIGGEVQ